MNLNKNILLFLYASNHNQIEEDNADDKELSIFPDIKTSLPIRHYSPILKGEGSYIYLVRSMLCVIVHSIECTK